MAFFLSFFFFPWGFFVLMRTSRRNMRWSFQWYADPATYCITQPNVVVLCDWSSLERALVGVISCSMICYPHIGALTFYLFLYQKSCVVWLRCVLSCKFFYHVFLGSQSRPSELVLNSFVHRYPELHFPQTRCLVLRKIIRKMDEKKHSPLFCAIFNRCQQLLQTKMKFLAT